MIIWLFDLFFHRHDWKLIETIKMDSTYSTGRLYIQHCESCKRYRAQKVAGGLIRDVK